MTQVMAVMALLDRSGMRTVRPATALYTLCRGSGGANDAWSSIGLV